LLCQRGKSLEHERVNIRAQFGNHERHPMGHRPADKINVATEPVQLGDGNLALQALGGS
jgi:hypothetical protein